MPELVVIIGRARRAGRRQSTLPGTAPLVYEGSD
jgi:hypothetical protein